MTRSLLLSTSLMAAFLAFAAPSASFAAEEKPAAEAAQKDYVVLKIDGSPVMFSEIMAVWKTFFPQGPAPDFNTFDEKVRQAILREIVSKRLVYTQAVKDGIDKSEEVQKRLDQLKRQLVIQVYVEGKSKDLVSDEKLRRAYEEKLKEFKSKDEIRARHILVANENEAKDILKRLKKGEKFEDLAKEKSTDKASAISGGDLDYFTEDKMVPEFGKAAFAMKTGEISDPVKSPFGWHIIKVEDRRKMTAPSFEQMKGQLVEQIVNEEVTKLLNGLMAKAEVKYYGPDGKEKPFSKTVPPKVMK